LKVSCRSIACVGLHPVTVTGVGSQSCAGYGDATDHDFCSPGAESHESFLGTRKGADELWIQYHADDSKDSNDIVRAEVGRLATKLFERLPSG
jgi:hypothetical protein